MEPYAVFLLVLCFGCSLAGVVKRQSIDEGAEVSPENPEERQTNAQSSLKTFWVQLAGVLGAQSQQFITVLAQNKGDLGKTLQQFRGQLGDSYASLLPMYEQFKPIWTGVVGTLGDSQVGQNAIKWFKGKLQSLTQGTALSSLFSNILNPPAQTEAIPTPPEFYLPGGETEAPETVADAAISN